VAFWLLPLVPCYWCIIFHLMGRNKNLRKKIEGHRRMVRQHRAKIERELQSTTPRDFLIAYWEKRIRQVEGEILRLEERLGQR